jgi:4-coumarate--CoA ligase
MMNEDGLVYILGRVKDRVKRAAISIEPAALEGCVSALTGSTTSVIGWPHPEMGEAPLMIVEDLNGNTVDEVKEEVLKKFGGEYALEYVVTFKQLGMQKWPINTTGKILKTELRSKVEAFFDSQQGKLT